MDTLEVVLRRAGILPRTATVGILSAIGSADPAGLTALREALALTFDIITDGLRGASGNAVVEIGCCFQTSVEIDLAQAASDKCGCAPGIVVPTELARLLDSISNVSRRETARDLLGDPSMLTILDELPPSLDEGPDEPTLGQRVVARTANLLFVAVADTATGMRWLTSLHNELAFRDGLVVMAVPRSDEPPCVLDAEGHDLGTMPIEVLRVRVLRQWSAWATNDEVARGKEIFSRWPRFSVGGAFNILIGLISGRKQEDRQLIAKSRPTSIATALAWPREIRVFDDPDVTRLEALRVQFAAPFAWADAWAIHFGNVFRSVCFLLLFLNLVALATAVLAYLDVSHKQLWHWVEFLSLLFVIGLYVWSRKARIQQKWVEYRLFAELLRPTPYFWAMADMYTPVEPHVQNPELQWWRATLTQYETLLRTMRPPRLHMTGRYVYGLKILLEEYIHAQVGWHTEFHKRHTLLHRRLVKAGRVAFWLVLGSAAGHLAVQRLAFGRSVWPGADDVLGALFLGTASILAAVGFAIGILINQLGPDQIAERSEIAARRLQTLLTRIRSHRVSLKREYLGRWLSECYEILIEEQNGWFRQTSKIAIHL